ncbi:glutamate receptor-like isoform X2 [Biomphalaria pfeifferi]|uniref:Glutamate receptor-like isoform X2 n=1 Tax=Biomphalaria pfeifferi TaxID=112525 RepID=A0AAD8F4J9_BIOPF|nr:glutamate receptor-like isoform X2 [Biomphalaria pfeifferi]
MFITLFYLSQSTVIEAHSSVSSAMYQQNSILVKSQISEYSENEVWSSLTEMGGAVLRHVMSYRHEKMADQTVAVMFEKFTRQQATILSNFISSENPKQTFVYFEIDDVNLDRTFQNLKRMKTRLDLVLLLAQNETLVHAIFDHVMSTTTFYWTALVHVTEWLIITNSSIATLINSAMPMPDFVTIVLLLGDKNIPVQQKSRIETLVEVINLELRYSDLRSNTNLSASGFCWTHDFITHNHDKLKNLEVSTEIGKSRFGTNVANQISTHVRKSGKLYLRSKRSILDGVHLKVSLFVFPDGQVKMVEERKEGNRTVVDGFYVKMLQLLQEGLGFTYDVILVNDSGFHGSVDQNDHANGIVGQLARREAAFTVMPMVVSESRLKVKDFLLVTPVREYYKVIYKLPEPGSALDTSYVDIIQSDLALTFLMGPLLIMAFIGAFLHVTSRSCTLANPQPCYFSALKELYFYPDHFCFETKVYASQSGRVLKATWGVFWLILSSAYSAYLTTTFAVKAKEMQINSYEALAEVQGYDIGVHASMNHLIAQVQNNSLDQTMEALSAKLRALNQSNPMTFSDNVTYHMDRVKRGGYVFLTMGLVPGLMEGDATTSDTLLRSSEMPESMSRINTGVATDVFFKEDLYIYLLKIKEYRILEKLHRDLFKPKAIVRATKASDESSVSIKKIELLIYAVLACLGISLGLLLIEVLVGKPLPEKDTLQWCIKQ